MPAHTNQAEIIIRRRSARGGVAGDFPIQRSDSSIRSSLNAAEFE